MDGDDGFLVLDKNRNGLIDDINKLFGGVGVWGFDELAQYYANGDGVIDAADLIYSELQVWQDFDQDGVTDDGELRSLADLGIVSITVDGEALDAVTPQGTTLRERGTFTWDTGEVGNVFEAIFELSDVDTKYMGETGLAEWLTGADAIGAKGFGRISDLAVASSNDFYLQELVRTAGVEMMTPDLKILREQAGDVLGQCSYAIELTRELTPVLVDRNGDAATLADHAVYVEYDTGGYWTLHSGAPIVDGAGVAIARPTLEDVMAQTTPVGQGLQLEQMWSPSTRAQPLQHRQEAPYLAEVIGGRVVVLDYGISNADGSWRLASGTDVTDAAGNVIAQPTREEVIALPTADGQIWRVEEIDFNPFAQIEVDHIGVNIVDGIVVDYTVEVTDQDGSFYLWARNLDRALELQRKFGTPRDFVLRNFEVDFETLDEVGSSDNSTFRVEPLTPALFHFATSSVGIDFQPQMLTAQIVSDTGFIDYSVNENDRASLVEGAYVSPITAMIELLDEVMEQYIITSRAFAVRMALQGGLKDFARGIAYDIESDSYSATTDYELAPMFEAIFEQAPAGYDEAYDCLTKWNEILNQIYPDYRVDGTGNTFGASVSIDQKFIMQMVIPAFEKVAIDLDMDAILNRLSVDETRLVEHAADATDVNGTSGTDYFYLTEGDQTYRGGLGADVYFVGGDWGNDIIEDVDFGESDELRFTSVTSEDVRARREGQDLYMSDADEQNVLIVRNYFLGELNPSFFGRTENTEMESIVFADGVVWDTFRTAMEVSNPLDSADIIIGSGAADVLEGGKGNDVLSGGAGGDFYIFRRGDGIDRINDSAGVSRTPSQAGLDFLQFLGDISSDDLFLTRVGESKDLQIFLLDENGERTGDAITIEDQFDGLVFNLGGFLQAIDPSLEALDYVAPSLIERFLFEDGTSLDVQQIQTRVLESAATDGEDAIYGFLTDDTLRGGLGDDLLVGREGQDTYHYARGDGSDVIYDGDNSVDLFGDSKNDDRLVFSGDMRWTDINFIREGATDNVALNIKGSDDTIYLKNMFKTGAFQGLINMIDYLEFSDGTVWHNSKLTQHIVDLARTDADDVIYGWDLGDRIDGGAGYDTLYVFGGSDTYTYARAYGSDVIVDSSGGNDRIVMRDIAFTDVDVLREGKDLIFRIKDTGETLTLTDQYSRFASQGQAVEYFEFSDGTLLFTQLNPHVVDVVGTSGDDVLYGSDFSEIMDGKAGNDTLYGGSDGDTYKFDVGYGNDTIIDVQLRTSWDDRFVGNFKETDDRVVFGADITRDNILFSKDANDLVISITGRDDTLRIRDQFAQIERGVERFEFADGTFMLISDVEERLAIVGGNRGDNIITGLLDQENVLDGRQGDDVLIGGRAADTYSFGAAYDLDRIEDRADGFAGAIDRLILGSTVDPATVILRRDGDDLVFDLGNGEDQLTIVGGLGLARIEEYNFSDGTVWTFADVQAALLRSTDGDDRIIGFDTLNDFIEGGAGSDALEGRSGNDTYHFDAGWGDDSILDSAGNDTVSFGPGLLISDVVFTTEDTNLIIRFRGLDGSIAILGGADPDNTSTAIENFVFDDGSSLTMDDVWTGIIAGQTTDQSDVINADVGSPVTFNVGRGNDVVW